jgi:hypothetical protein
VYSPVSLEKNLEKNTETFAKEKAIELTCSGGHTDQYRPSEIELVESKPAGKLKVRYAKAVGG